MTTHGIRGLLELSSSREPSPRDLVVEIETASWTARSGVLTSWMIAAYEPPDGGGDTVRQLLKRGDAHPTARNKCWEHIVMELENAPEWETVVVQAAAASEAATATSALPSIAQLNLAEAAPAPPDMSIPMSPPAAPASKANFLIDSTPPRSQSAQSSNRPSFQSEETENPLSARIAASTPLSPSSKANEQAQSNEVECAEAPCTEAPATAKPLSQMSMLERQAHFLNKKKQALEVQRLEKEKENESLSFKPDTQKSKQTYKARPPALNPGAPPAARGPAAVDAKPAVVWSARAGSKSGGTSSKWNTVKAKVLKGGGVKKLGVSGAGKTPKLAHSSADCDVAAASRAAVEATKAAADAAAQVTAAGAALAEIDALVEKAAAAMAPTAMSLAREASSRDAKNNDAEEGADGPEEEEGGSGRSEAQPYVPGTFWWKVDEGRGQLRINDGSEFQMFSIFRKKDKTRDVSGVSMLVGRLEKPPYEEKVIQMFFDVSIWTEEAAFDWWQQNSFRYLGGSCKDTGKLLVAHKPVPLLAKEAGVLKKLTETATKPFDALDPSFTADTNKAKGVAPFPDLI